MCVQEKDFGEALQGTQIQPKLVPNSLPKTSKIMYRGCGIVM